jgi:hypothetical protein
VVALLAGASGCPDSVGITCPTSDPECDEPDAAVPLDATAVDLVPAPDIATCTARCPDGCCDSLGVCHTTLGVTACGPPGGRCKDCDHTSDTCAPGGICVCGAASHACELGQECVAGLCVCSARSCPPDLGCCAGGKCTPVANTSLAACLPPIAGTANACVACDANTTDACTAKGCVCSGAGAPCASTQRCVGGQCVCDAQSCPPATGCCNGPTCLTSLDASHCTMATSSTNACAPCDPALADTCSPGHGCVCGQSTSYCPSTLRCVAGRCACSPQSCPAGCCFPGSAGASDYCIAPGTQGICGLPGGTCTKCESGRADRCSPNGGCSCGTAPECTSGFTCLNGYCQCCVGNVCTMCVMGQTTCNNGVCGP